MSGLAHDHAEIGTEPLLDDDADRLLITDRTRGEGVLTARSDCPDVLDHLLTERRVATSLDPWDRLSGRRSKR